MTRSMTFAILVLLVLALAVVAALLTRKCVSVVDPATGRRGGGCFSIWQKGWWKPTLGGVQALPTAAPARSSLPKEYEGYFPLVLRVGETGTAAGVAVTLEAVEDDSRCPWNVTCAWAGLATVRVTMTSPVSGAQPVVKMLSIWGSRTYNPPNAAGGPSPLADGRGNLASDTGARVYFVNLEPDREVVGKKKERRVPQIPESSYRATFAVRSGVE